jgi:hypothetical protein
MKNNVKYGLIILITAAILQSCIKDDVTNIQDNLLVSPTYSVPIGSISFVMDDIIGSSAFDTIPADTSLTNDSVFFFNDKRYAMPPDSYVDTVFLGTYDFSSLQEWIDKATYLMFRLNIENAIPAEVLVQVSLLDGSQNLLFSLLIPPGLIIPSESIVSPYDTDPLTITEIQLLPDARYVQVYVRLKIQPASSDVLYYSNQYFDVQIGVRIGLESNISE